MLSIFPKVMLAGAVVMVASSPAYAQDAPVRTALDSLIAESVPDHPTVRAAEARVRAARARVGPAGAWPNPMLMAGVENLPLGSEDGTAPAAGHGGATQAELPDMMTMKMLGVSQLVPFPGKLRAQRRAAEHAVVAADARLESERRRVIREISEAYYELAYLERAIQIIGESHAISENAESAAEARYVAGTGEQRAVLDARVATARFSEQAIALQAQLRSQRALLARAAGLANPPATTVAVVAPVADAADAALPSVAELKARALSANPELRARRAEIAALVYELEGARKAYLPDFDVSVRYGQRDGRPDMISASVGIPIPLHKERKENQLQRATEAELEVAHAELAEESNEVSAEVTRLHAELERIRAQLALFSKSILPQAEAAVASARAGVTAGRVELFSVLERQNTLLEYRLAFERLTAEFAQKLAQLEAVVGAEVLP